MKLHVKSFVFSLILLCFIVIGTKAEYTKISANEIGLEKIDNGVDYNYSIPKSILIVPIAQPTELEQIDPIEWYRGMYYYQTSRFVTPSINFHYVITNDGKLIEFDTENIDRKIEVENSTLDSPLVVGYFTTNAGTRFNPYARTQIEDIIIDLANKNAIPLENILIKGVLFSTSQNRELKMTAQEIYVGWQTDLDSIKEKIKDRYLPIDREYSVKSSNFELENKEVDIGSEVEVKIKVKNTGEFPIYPETGLLLTSRRPDSSQFFINNVWASQTQVQLANDNQKVLRPNEEVEYIFKVKIPFAIGKLSEEFEIRTNNGNVISENPILLEINVKKPDGEIIEIGDTGAGFLRVRKGPGISFEEVTRVSTGDKYFVLKRENGWVQIKLSEEKSGWVAGQYTKVL